MRVKLLILLAFVVLLSPLAFADEWIEYASRQDFFTVNFPRQPAIRDITYTTEYGIMLPGRVYSVDDGKNKYSVTVIDYTDAQKLHTARQAKCKADGGDGDSCNNPWAGDVRGAMVHAIFELLQRDAKVTHYANYNADLVEGHRLQLTNPDRSRTYAVVHMHDFRLYILEGTIAAGQPPPALFQQSLGFLDKEGKRIRYATTYSHGYPVPARTR
jgi:hypothetical protein